MIGVVFDAQRISRNCAGNRRPSNDHMSTNDVDRKFCVMCKLIFAKPVFSRLRLRFFRSHYTHIYIQSTIRMAINIHRNAKAKQSEINTSTSVAWARAHRHTLAVIKRSTERAKESVRYQDGSMIRGARPNGEIRSIKNEEKNERLNDATEKTIKTVKIVPITLEQDTYINYGDAHKMYPNEWNSASDRSRIYMKSQGKNSAVTYHDTSREIKTL